MKYLMKKILQYYLKYITKLVLMMHRPTIIAIAGSTNKTFVKDEINRVLGELLKNPPTPFIKGAFNKKSPNPLYQGGINHKGFNTEIGLPLAILNLSSGYNSYKNWLPVIYKAALKIFQFNFPKFLVLELGVSDPGDMKYLLTIIKPKIVVITDITQRYLEGFDDMDELVDEYEYLVKKTNKSGLAVLNYDNPRIKEMANVSGIKVKFFGLTDGADWQAVEIKKEDRGQLVEVKHNSIVSRHEINKFGQHHIDALLIGLAIRNYLKF